MNELTFTIDGQMQKAWNSDAPSDCMAVNEFLKMPQQISAIFRKNVVVRDTNGTVLHTVIFVPKMEDL